MSKNMIQIYKDRNLCTRCGKVRDRENKLTCQACNDYRISRGYNNKLEKFWGRQKLCLGCGKTRFPNRARCEKCLVAIRSRSKKSHLKIKMLVHAAYGNKCACCGETEVKFLQVDHIEGRKVEDNFCGGEIYRYIIKNNYPKNFQLLCANCNWSKGIFGECPHKTKSIGASSVS